MDLPHEAHPDDPDDRRTYPWADTGGSPDTSLEAWYASLSKLRSKTDALESGDLRILDAGSKVAAYGRKTDKQAALVGLQFETPETQGRGGGGGSHGQT